MKTIIASGILLGAVHGSVVTAAPYANIENNSSWLDSEFGSGVTEVHAGYAFDNGVYFQGGPAYISVDGEENTTEYSGKVGYSRDLSEDLNLYGEVSFVTEDQEFEFDQLNFGTKLGVTYSF